MSPDSQSAPAGASSNYTVSLANNDSAGCGASTFGLSGTVPTGWTGALSATSLTLQPGSAAQIDFTLVSATSAGAGSYQATVTTTDVATGSHTISKSVVHTVVDTVSPSAPQDLRAQVRKQRVELTWGPATDDNGVAGYRVLRDGTLVADTAALDWTDTDLSGASAYTYFVVAYDEAGNVSPPSNSVSVKLSGGGSGGGGGGKPRK